MVADPRYSEHRVASAVARQTERLRRADRLEEEAAAMERERLADAELEEVVAGRMRYPKLTEDRWVSLVEYHAQRPQDKSSAALAALKIIGERNGWTEPAARGGEGLGRTEDELSAMTDEDLARLVATRGAGR